MAHTYDVSTSRGQVRLLLDDTVTGSWTWLDTEIDAFLTLGDDSVLKATEYGWRNIAASFKKLITCRFFGEVYADPSSARKAAIEMANSYAELAMQGTELQVVQLQQKIDYYGRIRTEYDLTTAVTQSEFTDFAEDRWDAL